MFFKPSIIAFFLSFAITLIVGLTVFLWNGFSLSGYWIIPALVMVATYICGFWILKKLVFEELEAIGRLLENIRKEDYRFEKKRFNDDGNPLNIIKKEIFDFAEKKQAEINELKKLETFRREFLADVSHELKTPIFSAQGFVHTLIDGAVDDLKVRDRFLEKAATSLDALNVLVGDLITISQLEIGEITMHPSSFDLRRLCETVIEQLEDAAIRRSVRVHIHRYAPKSCYVHADRNRMGQVLTNLIMNAIKYGKEGGMVMVKLQPEGREVMVSVNDNGPGIPSVYLKRIFERFYRVDKSRSRDSGGTGLGLSIVKHILEAHDSRIYVESTVGRGTTFYFKLKLGRVINENG